MAQTTNAISMKDCTVFLSTDGTTFTDVSGWAGSVDVGGGDRSTGEAYTFDGSFAIVTAGKSEPFEVTAKVIYTEGSTDPFENFVRPAYENGTALYMRWSPRGAASGTGENVFTTSRGWVIHHPYPMGEAESGDPVAFELTLKCTQITRTTSTT